MMADDLVHWTLRDGIARVQLDKPPVNAFDLRLVRVLAEVVRELSVCGAGAAVFSGRGLGLSAGGDIKWVHDRAADRDAATLRTFFREIQEVFDSIDRLPMPTIAVIHGMALGGGLEIALACDLRVATDDARIGFPEATIGLIPAAGGTQRLTEIAGRPLALELMYSGRMIDAEDARAHGLLNRVVAPDELDEAVDALVASVLRCTPAALAAIKSCVRTRFEEGRAAGFRLEREFAEQLAFDRDAVERLQAFHERSALNSLRRQPERQGA